jgi:hypothetical protein
MADIVYNTLHDALQNGSGCLIGRNGNVEMGAVIHNTLGNKWNSTMKFYVERTGWFCSDNESSDISLDKWVKSILHATTNCDVIVSPWYPIIMAHEERLLNEYAPSVKRIQLSDLEPYRSPVNLRWTQLLTGKTVGIINAFANTAVHQTKRAHLIWPNDMDSLIPEALYIAIPTFFSPGITEERATWPAGIDNWNNAVDYLEKKCVQSGIQVAIIGCGSLGMILGARLKRHGICCIVMGGAIQCLFGIKGKRWETESEGLIRSFWNSAWCAPSREETPDGYLTIENGCYWMDGII